MIRNMRGMTWPVQRRKALGETGALRVVPFVISCSEYVRYPLVDDLLLAVDALGINPEQDVHPVAGTGGLVVTCDTSPTVQVLSAFLAAGHPVARAISVPLERVTRGQPRSLTTGRTPSSAALPGVINALPKLTARFTPEVLSRNHGP